MAQGEVLFMRGEKSCSEEDPQLSDWDDTLLISAYDNAVTLAKQELSEQMEMDHSGNSSKTKRRGKSKHGIKQDWQVGNCCRTIFKEDGLEYEAVIIKMIPEKNACHVRFVGYNNEDIVQLRELHPSLGHSSRKTQHKLALEDSCLESSDGSSKNNSRSSKYQNQSDTIFAMPRCLPPFSFPNGGAGLKMPPPPPLFHVPNMSSVPLIPPPPPAANLSALCPNDSEEALSSMLMSWYMNGFHTGYYQGLKQAKSNAK